MVVQSEQDRIRQLLSRALPLLCKSGLSFTNEFSIEALIGITLDKDDVFLVSIKETFSCDDKSHEFVDSSTSATLEMTVSDEPNHLSLGSPFSNRRGRKRKSEPVRNETSDVHVGELCFSSNYIINDGRGPFSCFL